MGRHHQPHGGVHLGQLLQDDDVVHVGVARAAELGGEGDAQQANVAQLAGQALRTVIYIQQDRVESPRVRANYVENIALQYARARIIQAAGKDFRQTWSCAGDLIIFIRNRIL